MARTIDRSTLVKQLASLGLARGGVLVVHTAFSKVAPVEGGPHGLIEALREALGPDGTLVMPSMTDDDDHPFSAAETPCQTLGVVANTFWQLPGVLRSDNPHAFAAIGPRASALIARHSLDVPHGPESPIGRAFDLDAQVLLIGVGHGADTMIHLAENLAAVRYGRYKYVTVWQDGRPTRYRYFEVDHCCENFSFMDEWLGQLQLRGIVGHGEGRLARSRDIVHSALKHLAEDETVFLHPLGVCQECDEARSGVGRSP
jgi:aminoglycoside 3-N-acetyltransferase